jgi:predicted PurR-regulated permease PerM
MVEKNKVLTVLASMLIVVVAFIILKELKSILIPFFVAVILSLIFEPLYNILRQKKIPSPVAIIVVLLIIIVIANIASVFIITSINSFAADFPKYETKFRDFIVSILQMFRLSDTEIQTINESMQLKNLLMQGSLTTAMTALFSSVIGIFGDFVLILIYVVFLLSEMGSIRERIKRAYTQERSDKIAEIVSQIFNDIKKYIAGKTLINLIQGIVFGLILWAFGVDFYLVWGFLCFITHYIPNIGSLISTILPGLTALLQFDNIVTPIIIIILLIVVQNVIGNIFEPKYLGDQLDLSPLLLLFSLIFWGYVWGIVGMILSVPIMSMLKIVLSKFEETKSLSILMSYNKNIPPENRLRTRIKAIIKRKKIE